MAMGIIIGIDCEDEGSYNQFVQSVEFQSELKHGVAIEESETWIYNNRCFKMMEFTYWNKEAMKRLINQILDYNHQACATRCTINCMHSIGKR